MWAEQQHQNIIVRQHEISYNVIYATRKASDQPDYSKKEGKDQESIQSSTTPHPGYQWERDSFTIINLYK